MGFGGEQVFAKYRHIPFPPHISSIPLTSITGIFSLHSAQSPQVHGLTQTDAWTLIIIAVVPSARCWSKLRPSQYLIISEKSDSIFTHLYWAKTGVAAKIVSKVLDFLRLEMISSFGEMIITR